MPTAEQSPLAPPPENPRAFAQGVGTVLQTVGIILFLTTCCVCTFSGAWDQRGNFGQWVLATGAQPVSAVTPSVLLERPALAGYMLMAMFMTVGGLALAGFGLGLQSQKMSSAWGALITNVLLLAMLTAAGAGLWVGGATIIAHLWHAILSLVTLGLLPFTLGAWRQMRANPPPPGLDILPKDFEIPKRMH